jgi:hypothetical protein
MESLHEVVHRLDSASRRPGGQSDKPDLGPGSPFDALLEQRVEELERQVREMRARQFGLVFVLAGGVVVTLITRVLGL